MNLARAQTCTSACHRWFNERNMNLQIAGNESSNRSLWARWGYLPNIPGVWFTGCCRAYLSLSLWEGRLLCLGEECGPPSLRWWALTAPSQIRASQKCWQPSQCREIRLQHAQHPFPPVQLVIVALCLTVCCASAVCSGETVHSCILAAVPSAHLHGAAGHCVRQISLQ